MRVELPAITVTVNGTDQVASTTIATAGPYVVVVATTLPDLVYSVTSVYLGDLDGTVAASHLHLTARGGQRLEQRKLAAVGPGATHARACLLDHAAELNAALGGNAQIDVGPAALEHAAAAWQPGH